MSDDEQPPAKKSKDPAQLQKEFHLMLRQVLLVIVHWIEDEYHLEPSNKYRQYFQKYGLGRPN